MAESGEDVHSQVNNNKNLPGTVFPLLLLGIQVEMVRRVFNNRIRILPTYVSSVKNENEPTIEMVTLRI